MEKSQYLFKSAHTFN